MIEIAILSKGEVADYPELVMTIKEMLPELDDEEYLKILSLIINICPYCHKASVGCQCWNDE